MAEAGDKETSSSERGFLSCGNPNCINLSGPSELHLTTFACGAGCGVRYCSEECQGQAWRLGHKWSCGEIVRRYGAESFQPI